MPTSSVFAYSPSSGVINWTTSTATLDVDYNHTQDRVRIDFSDDDNYLDGDNSNQEVGEDAGQTATVYDMAGGTLQSGRVYVEGYGRLQSPDGDFIDVYEIEIGGVVVGYLPTEPLVPGVTYTITSINNVDDGVSQPVENPGDSAFYGSDNRMTYDQAEANSVPCFAGGTLIGMAEGDERPVDWLQPGDRVMTCDHGPQPVLWVGRFRPPRSPSADPATDPVHIPPGALGPGLPARRLSVSPQHFLQLSGARSQLYFGEAEVHVAARHLLGWNGIFQDRPGPLFRYFHILFARPEVIRANGTWAESLFLGDRQAEFFGAAARAQIAALKLPENAHAAAARPRLRRREATLLQPPAPPRVEARSRAGALA